MEEEYNSSFPVPPTEEELQDIESEIDSAPIQPVEETVPIEPEVIQQGSFAPPFRSKIGNSTIDLSDPEAEDQMKAEYDEWWNFGKKRFAGIVPYISDEFKGERDKLKEKWYRKYHGMSLEDYDEARRENATTIYGHSPNLRGIADQMDRNFQALSTPGLAWADFGMDAAGTLIPGMGKVDDRWDEATRLDDPVFQNVRRILSIVLPAIKTGQLTHTGLNSAGVQNLPRLQRLLTNIGAYGMADGAVTILSDTSEDHNASKTLSDLIPGLFGPKGSVPLPESWKTKESDSPAVRKQMNFYENTVLSTFGVILGAAIDAKSSLKTSMDFMEPLDESAVNYKQLELLKDTDSEDLIKLQELNTILSTQKLSRQNELSLIHI